MEYIVKKLLFEGVRALVHLIMSEFQNIKIGLSGIKIHVKKPTCGKYRVKNIIFTNFYIYTLFVNR